MKRTIGMTLVTTLGLAGIVPACTSRTSHDGKVDLTIGFEAPLLAPGGSGSITLHVGNRGPAAARGAEVTVVTPFFVNFARPVPQDCELRYQNPDPFVPEVLVCRLSGEIEPGAERTLSVPVTLSPGGPRNRNFGSALVLPADSRDRELSLSDNLTQASVVRLRQAGEQPPAGNSVGIYLAADEPPISTSSNTVTTLTVGNAGPHAATAPIRVLYRTPFYANIDPDTPLPPDCKMVLTDPAPNIPEIVECAVAAGLGAGEERQLRIPLTLVPDGPTGLQVAFGLAAPSPGSADVDPFMVDNVHFIGLMMLTGPGARALTPNTAGTTLAGEPARLTTEPEPTPDRAVDLSVAPFNIVATPGTKTLATFRVLNRGNLTTQSPARLVVVPPVYSNVDPGRLPAACRVVVRNPEPNIPEVAECSIPAGIAPGEERTIELPLQVLPGGPVGIGAGAMFVGAGPNDVEAFVTDNASLFGLQRSAYANASPAPEEGVDLWISADQTALSTNRPRGTTLRYGNVGRLPTRGPSQLVYTTPFYVNIDRTSPLPEGCQVQADHPDPLIPELVLCTIPPGLEPGQERQLTIPVKLEPHGPAGALAGSVSIVPDPHENAVDVETHYDDNLHGSSIIAVRN